jgi:hypothetical protein
VRHGQLPKMTESPDCQHLLVRLACLPAAGISAE